MMVQFTRIWHYAQLREALQTQEKLGELSWSQARPVEPGGNIGLVTRTSRLWVLCELIRR